ncbi:MAG: hypothetical protein IKN16_10650 [Selenomonadaceae bacterium]|nr:hypothetical protein [Selenomonadaceae bacterium]
MKYSIKNVLSDATQRLSAQEIDTPRLDAEILTLQSRISSRNSENFSAL